MGGATLAEIHMDNNLPGGIEIDKHLYRFLPEFFKIIIHKICGD